jgi:prefoldin subunit 5
MDEQQQHLTQLLEQKNNLTKQLGVIQGQSVRTNEVLLKTQGAIEYLEAVGVKLSEPEAEAPAEEG